MYLIRQVAGAGALIEQLAAIYLAFLRGVITMQRNYFEEAGI